MQGEARPGEHGDAGRRGGRRRRRRRGGRREGGEQPYEAAPRPEQQGAFAGEPDERGGEEFGYARESASESYGDGSRRRRRGRRGGRRRRGREGEPFEAAPSFEPELDSAVADFDRPATASHRAYAEPAVEEHPAPPRPQPTYSESPAAPPSEPPAAQAEPPPAQAEPLPAQAEAPPAQPEPPRRRSTVREPAPFFFGGDRPAESAATEPPPAPAAAPAASSPAPEPAVPDPVPESSDANQPRKSGWWSRRFAGGKG
jgi:ribonuclease E